MITFDVYGTPAPKGSGRAIMRGGYAVHVPSGSDQNRSQLESWAATVRAYARDAVGAVTPPLFVEQPLLVVLTFFLPRPASHFGSGRNAGQLKPGASCYPSAKKLDADKLARATLDAMTGIVYDDDGRIVELLVRKRYATSADDVGATIVVDEMPAAVARGTRAA